MKGSLTPEERARITELQDQLIERFLNHKLAVEQGKEHQARALEMEIDELLREKKDIEAWASYGLGLALGSPSDGSQCRH